MQSLTNSIESDWQGASFWLNSPTGSVSDVLCCSGLVECDPQVNRENADFQTKPEQTDQQAPVKKRRRVAVMQAPEEHRLCESCPYYDDIVVLSDLSQVR
jgi:hypothetical protein